MPWRLFSSPVPRAAWPCARPEGRGPWPETSPPDDNAASLGYKPLNRERYAPLTANRPARFRWQADGGSFPHAQPANASRPRGYRKARRARFWAGPVRPLGVQATRRGRAGLRLVLRREGRHLACRRQPDDANLLRQPACAAAWPADGRSAISCGRNRRRAGDEIARRRAGGWARIGSSRRRHVLLWPDGFRAGAAGQASIRGAGRSGASALLRTRRRRLRRRAGQGAAGKVAPLFLEASALSREKGALGDDAMLKPQIRSLRLTKLLNGMLQRGPTKPLFALW